MQKRAKNDRCWVRKGVFFFCPGGQVGNPPPPAPYSEGVECKKKVSDVCEMQIPSFQSHLHQKIASCHPKMGQKRPLGKVFFGLRLRSATPPPFSDGYETREPHSQVCQHQDYANFHQKWAKNHHCCVKIGFFWALIGRCPLPTLFSGC